MRSFNLKTDQGEDGPYKEAQIAQMFADGRVDRHTPCKPVDRGEWKTIDEYLPMLKYGTQLPPAQIRSVPPELPTAVSLQRISIVDFDIPFLSVPKIMFKWMAAGFVVLCCFLPAIIVVWLIVMALFAGLIGASLHHP